MRRYLTEMDKSQAAQYQMQEQQAREKKWQAKGEDHPNGAGSKGDWKREDCSKGGDRKGGKDDKWKPRPETPRTVNKHIRTIGDEVGDKVISYIQAPKQPASNPHIPYPTLPQV